MPVVDGLEAARRIRAEPAGASVPIIAMTANAFSEDREACLAAGMSDHVAKPVDPDVMYATLLRWLPPREALPPPPPPPAAAEDEETQLRARLDAIPGFDVAAALRNVGGRMNSLVRILRHFIDAYQEGLPVPSETQGDAMQDMQRWRAACHSLSGALVTLGIRGLDDEVRVLERELAGKDAPAARALVARQGPRLHGHLLELVRQVEAALG